MFERFSLAAKLIFGLSTIPLAVWLGAYATSGSKPLGVVVRRHFRPIVIALVVAKLVSDHYARSRGAEWADYVSLALVYLLAAMFIPMLRRLQAKTESEQAQLKGES